MSDPNLERKLARLDAMEAMFATEGWEYLVADMREEYERLGSIEGIADGTQLIQHKAIRESLFVLLHYPTVCEHQRRELDETQEDDSDGA